MRRRFLLALIAALTMAVLLTAAASAYHETNVTWIKVREKGATLRSSPDCPPDNSNKITGIHPNEYLRVLGKQGNWYYVSFRGCYGYVSASPMYVRVISTGENDLPYSDIYEDASGVRIVIHAP